MSKVTQPNKSYHVSIYNATGHVECTCLGIECVEMPLWIQERISLLMMLESKATLVKIGMKIDDNTFVIDEE